MPDQAKKRPNINLDQARAWGLRFCAERNARQLAHQEIADQLLLSKQQAIGLETADLTSFYSAKIFAQAADKYALFLDFKDIPSLGLFGSETDCPQTTIDAGAAMDLPAPEAVTSVSDQSYKTPKISTLKIVSGIALALMAAFAGKALLETRPAIAPVSVATPPAVEPTPPAASPTPTTTTTTETASATPTPTAQTPNNPEKIEPTKTEPVKAEPLEKAAASNTIAAGHIRIKFTGSSWVQSVDKNGSKQEKVYRNGDTLDLQSAKLQALVIGNANAVTIHSNDAQISLKPYIASGSQVARIVGPDIRKLGD